MLFDLRIVDTGPWERGGRPIAVRVAASLLVPGDLHRPPHMLARDVENRGQQLCFQRPVSFVASQLPT
jgi:hypothetical protein